MTRVLVCLPEIPNARISGGYGRNVEIIRSLRRLGCDTTVVALTSHRDGGATQLLAAEGIRIVALDRDGVPLPSQLASGFDVIFITYYELAEKLLPLVREYARDASVVIDSVDVHFLRALRQAQVEEDMAGVVRARAVRERELATYQHADVLLAVSEREQDLLSELVPGIPVGVVPSIHGVDSSAPGPGERQGALFVGAYNFAPNRDAAHYLCTEIMPMLRNLGYEQQVDLVGPYLDEELASLAHSSRATPVGFVEQLAPLYRRRRVFISPVRFGSGVKTKVGEALGVGLPVVGTTPGTEGFPDNAGIIQLDEPDALARAILALDDDDEWGRRSAAGQELISTCYGPDRCDRELGEVIEYILARRDAAA
jgi:glycosyltransferase involved in cell wall biosynthesis